jgi:hypothetical protein
MAAVLEKVRQLERYVQLTNGHVDQYLERMLDKALERERQRLLRQQTRLDSHVAEFERRYGWRSDEFYPRFERGELGDDMDFIEWSATIEMIANLQCALNALGQRETS